MYKKQKGVKRYLPRPLSKHQKWYKNLFIYKTIKHSLFFKDFFYTQIHSNTRTLS